MLGLSPQAIIQYILRTYDFKYLYVYFCMNKNLYLIINILINNCITFGWKKGLKKRFFHLSRSVYFTLNFI